VSIPVYATRFGQPLGGAAIRFDFDDSQLQPSDGQSPYVSPAPDTGVALPKAALGFAQTATTDARGIATCTVTGSDPGTPRWFNNGADYGIDGQVYGVRPSFADPRLAQGLVNPLNFISFLLWSGYGPGNPVTWDDIQPIFQQYANLYPVMIRFLNMADLASVKANAHLLTLAFGLPATDPNAMPVTRDLSPAKRAAILAWLKNPLPGTAKAPAGQAETIAVPSAPPAVKDPPNGGKQAALARRPSVQNR
jgi:hypothetical protein